MGYCQHPLSDVPPCTYAAFVGLTRNKKGARWKLVAEEMDRIFSELDLSKFFERKGQWGIHPVRVCMLLVLQMMECLSDRQAADQVQFNIAWKYILRIRLDHPGWDASTWTGMRQRFLDEGGLIPFLDAFLNKAEERGILHVSKQRTDATHIVGYVKSLNRTELILESVRNCLVELGDTAPEFLRKIQKSHFYQQYFIGRPFNYRLPKSEKERLQLAEQAGMDGYHILDCISSTPRKLQMELSNLPSVETLRRVLEEQFEREGKGGPPTFKKAEQLKPSGERLASPYEPEARVALKGTHACTGYKCHITETCSASAPRLITQVMVTPSTENDSIALPNILNNLIDTGRKPDTLYVDSGYVNVDFLFEAKEKLKIDVVTRLANGHSWQSQAGKGFDQTNFQIDWKRQVVRCPSGKVSVEWKKTKDGGANAHFSAEDCMQCPFKEDCTKGTNRVLRLKSESVWRYMQMMRERQLNPEMKREMAARAGIEGTHTLLIRHSGRQALVRGKKKVALKLILSAFAVNLERTVRWLIGERPRPTPVTRAQQILAVA